MPRLVFMNDRLVPESEARVSVFDHGLLYGDGVFEGLRSYGDEFSGSTPISIGSTPAPAPSA